MHHENIIMLNGCALSTNIKIREIASKYYIQGEIDTWTILVGYFNIIFSKIDRMIKKKISKDVNNWNYANQFDVTFMENPTQQ